MSNRSVFQPRLKHDLQDCLTLLKVLKRMCCTLHFGKDSNDVSIRSYSAMVSIFELLEQVIKENVDTSD